MRYRIIYILVLLSLFGSAQRIQNFNLSLTGTVVSVRFSISAGGTCGGWSVLHSIDSLNYYPIYNYPGICGNANTKEDHSFDHASPTPDIVNFYKIELTALETSPPMRIYVPGSAKVNMLLYPNPVFYYSDQLNIKIFNASNTRLVGFLYNQVGKPLREIDFTTVGDLATMNVFDLDNGMYAIWLTDGYVVYSSKFIINR